VSCNGSKKEITVVGVDRHGKVSEVNVTLRSLGVTSRPVFLGTSKCCGVFSPSTAIQDASGHTWTLEHIVQDISIGELRFEVLLYVDKMLSRQQQIHLLWDKLCSEAAFSDDTTVVIRCRGALKVPDNGSELGCFIQRGERLYFRLIKSSLEQILKERRERELMNGLTQVFRNEDGLCEFGRNDVYLAMTIGGLLTADKKSYELIYDSLQHTSAIYLRTPAEETLSLGKGRCVHVIGEPYADWEISWSAPSWNPLCNGIVMMGSRST